MTTRQPFTPASLPPTSLIIGSRNRQALLRETVESVLQGDEVPTEVIIVDQSDRAQATLAALKATCPCEIRYQWMQSRGVSRARNMGIAAARHGIVAIIDDDMFVAATWFGSLIRALLNAPVRSVVTGQVRPAKSRQPGGFAPSIRVDERPAVYEGRLAKDPLFTGNMAMYRAAVDDVGTFEERLGPGSRFPSSEDNDFGFRLLEAGYRIIYVPEAVLYHRAWRPRRDYLPLHWSYGVGQGAYYTKHLTLRDRYMLRRMVWDIERCILLFPRHVCHKPHQACADAVYVLGILFGAVQWLLTQRATY